MRYAGVLLIFVSCAGCGFLLSGRLAARVGKLLQADRLLTDMIGMIRDQNLPTGEILARLREEGYPIGECDTPAEAMENFAADPLFEREEREILHRTGQLVGASSRESQTARLELEQHSLRRILTEAEKDRDSRGRLFRSMGLLMGALAAVFVI